MLKINSKYRPQVLLLGNGLNRTYGGSSWKDFLHKISMRSDLPDELNCPYPLQAVLVTNDNVKNELKRHKDEFYGIVEDDLSQKLNILLELGFDDIITTNYSYELEATAASTSIVKDYFLKKTCKNICDGKRVEGRYLISTYQDLKCNQTPNRVWHIHGEARKSDSMILGHYYYAGLLHKINTYLNEKKNIYQKKQENCEELTLKSWIDSFILGDIYILGFGMEFSEIDLWWLLNRKKREKAVHGQVYFYTPDGGQFNEKEELLKLLDVEIVHCDCVIPYETDDKINTLYDCFYEKAIQDISEKVRIKTEKRK